ncbi:MAG TPA: cytochrome C [Thiolapillus brandeum]|uniref:Cytochrome C n=1 Tax=Thiolapillus brandeum TaxID=1076588 RepID=A0A831NRL4_9GAMM|nr:cytochrome C [Thiolapillus brandeum]
MSNFTRRKFLKVTGAAAAASSALTFSSFAIGGAKKKVVIVGGGIGGATAAKYLKMMDSSIDVTVIEANKDYYTCFMSNEVLGGERSIDSIRFGYTGLAGHGVKVVHDWVTGIDAGKRVVKTKGGKSFSYDRCIVSPGVDFKWETIEGYDAKVAEKIPHAWKAGPQTALLRKQLVAMRNGGTVIIAPPPNPFRCPPGPYERASQIAHYLKKHKPKSKILILDPKDKFSKFGLFTDGWKRHYGYGTDNSMITWINGANGGKITGVDANSWTVSADVEDFKGDVINIIPAQKAGKIAFMAGLTNEKGWCPIDGKTFESTIHKNIHVIGDSAVASPLPKSGYAANSEAKVCAAAIVAMLNGGKAPQPSYVNTCYSVIAPGDGISVAMVYAYKDGKIIKVKGSGGLTPSKFDPEMRAREEQYAHSWFNNITADVFG